MQSKQYFTKIKNYPHEKSTEPLFFLSNEDYMGKGYKIKKEQRLAPTFVNLKSNTMKNTLQRYGLL